MKHALAPILDIVLTPLALAFAPVAFALGRMGHHAPLSRSLIDRVGVGIVRRHYYQPLVRADDLTRPLDQERPLPGLALNEAAQLALVEQFRYGAELHAFSRGASGPLDYFYDNPAYGPGDGEFLYDMIRHFKPRGLLEIGSGHSTRMAAAAIKANRAEDPAYSCKHVCVEPFKNPWLEELGIEVIRERVELVDPTIFRTLSRNDILFIDSTHVIRPQGDVLYEYLYLIPQLAPGVIVHVHDIFTPRDYLADWVLNRRLMWNEQYILEAFLSFNPAFEVLLAANWLAHNHRDKLKEAAPILAEDAAAEPGAFWFRRKT